LSLFYFVVIPQSFTLLSFRSEAEESAVDQATLSEKIATSFDKGTA